MLHLDAYLASLPHLDEGGLRSLRKTGEDFVANHIARFDHQSRITGLLYGQVQSGKTAHMFAILAAVADADPGFSTFVLLTANNVPLQTQTFLRALKQLSTFNVCDEHDDARYLHVSAAKPSLLVLKKDSNVLKTWRANVEGNPHVKSGPIFILDDEADNASQNTQVNKRASSATFRLLSEMRNLGTSSIFVQVTATPQAIFLQATDHVNRPSFTSYFEPGPGYLGGDFFFTSPMAYTQIPILETEKSALLSSRTNSKTNGLDRAICSFLVVCAQFSSEKKTNANFLIHPSHLQADHEIVRSQVEAKLRKFIDTIDDLETKTRLAIEHADLQRSCERLISLDEVLAFVQNRPDINVYKLNAESDAERGNSFDAGFNVVVGGNTLGRGVTFPALQTIYYVRSSQIPQADTYWQHSRMFGYDRDKRLIRVFMPPSSFRIFRVLHESNEKLISMMRSGKFEEVNIVLPRGFRPTRSAVVSRDSYVGVVGGTNYFPAEPNDEILNQGDDLLGALDETRDGHLVASELLLDLVKISDTGDQSAWPSTSFAGAIYGLGQSNPNQAHRVIVRRNRDIGPNTGTMLSEDDRRIGAQFSKDIVVTAYRLTGTKWPKLQPFWLFNVRLPDGYVFHSAK
jgi:hypothetical protein